LWESPSALLRRGFSLFLEQAPLLGVVCVESLPATVSSLLGVFFVSLSRRRPWTLVFSSRRCPSSQTRLQPSFSSFFVSSSFKARLPGLVRTCWSLSWCRVPNHTEIETPLSPFSLLSEWTFFSGSCEDLYFSSSSLLPIPDHPPPGLTARSRRCFLSQGGDVFLLLLLRKYFVHSFFFFSRLFAWAFPLRELAGPSFFGSTWESLFPCESCFSSPCSPAPPQHSPPSRPRRRSAFLQHPDFFQQASRVLEHAHSLRPGLSNRLSLPSRPKRHPTHSPSSKDKELSMATGPLSLP